MTAPRLWLELVAFTVLLLAFLILTPALVHQADQLHPCGPTVPVPSGSTDRGRSI